MARVDPTLAALRAHEVPGWWRAAKLGIFVHWTPASVAGFAPAHGDYGELLTSGRRDAFSYSPYTEWYQNSLRFPGSPVARHHAEAWGDRPYEAFVTDFEAGLSTWDPEAWARAFADTGAGYVVLVAKHHDGWCLWPSAIENPHKPGWHSSRDLVGELAAAVRDAGMRFGVYYSGGLDWTFCDTPMGSMGSMVQAIPRGDYPAYAEAQVRELIERYEPSVLWNDIAWPAPGRELWPLMADYYRTVPEASSTIAGCRGRRCSPWPRRGSAAGRSTGPHDVKPTPTAAWCHRGRRTSTCARRSTPPSPRSRRPRGSACEGWTTPLGTTPSRLPMISSPVRTS